MNLGAQRTISPEAISGAILARVESLTLIISGLATAWAAWRWGWQGAAGLAVGAALSWVNFRWLKGSVRAFGSAAAALRTESAGPGAGNSDAPRASAEVVTPQEAVNPVAPAARVGQAAPQARVTKTAYFRFLGRYVLLLGGVYVILTRTPLPAVSVFVGLFAVPAAVIGGAIYELTSAGVRQAWH